jgi:CRP-like cAMP-binding protein
MVVRTVKVWFGGDFGRTSDGTQVMTKFWYLRNTGLFRGLSDEEVRMIDRYSFMQQIRRGQAIYLQGTPARNVYILKKGVVKINRLTSQGKEIILDIIKKGSIFGDMALAEPDEMNESAEAIEDGVICGLNGEDFERLIQKMPTLSKRVTRMIGSRRYRVENKLVDLLFRTVEQRFAKTLLSLVDDFGIPHDDGFLLKIRLTHKDYAALIASTRETVTATVNSLKSRGLIGIEDKYLIIRSLDGVRAIAH